MSTKDENTTKAQHEANLPVSCCGYSIGDYVNTPFGTGFVWKVTENSVHVKHRYHREGINYLYSKYLVQTKHHSQNPITVISHCR